MRPSHVVEIAYRVADEQKESVRRQRINKALNIGAGIAVYGYVIAAVVVIVWLIRG